MTAEQLEGLSPETIKGIEQLEAKFKDRKVKIVGKHPWAGRYGVSKRIDIMGNRPAMIVEVDETGGTECAVFHASNLILLP